MFLCSLPISAVTFKGVLFTSAILDKFLHLFPKIIGGHYGREGPMHIVFPTQIVNLCGKQE